VFRIRGNFVLLSQNGAHRTKRNHHCCCSFRYRIAQFAMIAATSVHVLRVRPGSTILDANMLVETAKSIGNWALAAEQFLSSQPDDYFGRFGNISVNDVYTVKDVPDAVPPSPPVRDPGIHMHGMHAVMKLLSYGNHDGACRLAHHVAAHVACMVSLTSTATASATMVGRPGCYPLLA
jgi:hypothetical protein